MISNDRFFHLYEDENHTDYENENRTNYVDEAAATHDDASGVDNREIRIIQLVRERIANMIWNDL